MQWDLADNDFWRHAGDDDLVTAIQQQQDVNASISGQHTLLHFACGFDRRPAIVEELLRLGANPNSINHNGNTPLHLTAQRVSDPQVVSLLLDAGAQLNVRNNKGETPLDTAIDCDNWAIAQELGLNLSQAGMSPQNSDLANKIEALGCERYRYLDAIWFRHGFWDRQKGHERFYPMQSQDSIWLGSHGNDGLTDKIILAFETTRTRPLSESTLPDCTPERVRRIRQLHHSTSGDDLLEGQAMLTAMILGRSDSTVQAEIILGRPYWELTMVVGADPDPFGGSISGINQSAGATARNIITEGTNIMERLGLWAYNYWISETELMVAAARPEDASAPQNRGEYEQIIPLLTIGPEGSRPIYPDSLMEWSNNQRSAHEPAVSWEDIEKSDAALRIAFERVPALRELLDSEAHCADGAELVRRLVRLGKFGYSNPIFRWYNTPRQNGQNSPMEDTLL